MFAIRHRSIPNLYFHLPEGGRKRATMEFKPNSVPRLFRLRKHATLALSNWVAKRQPKASPIRDRAWTRNAQDWEIIEVEVRPLELKQVETSLK